MDSAKFSGPAASILVVDDAGDVRSGLCDILRCEGYRVIDAANGADALNQLRTDGLADLVLLDLRMPVMDGYEFLKRRAADTALSQIPVILVSGSDVLSATDLKKDHPGLVSVKKPINLSLLFSLIRRQITSTIAATSDGLRRENEHR